MSDPYLDMLYSTFVRYINLRSFSSIWYWASVLVMWSVLTNWVMGIPYDMVTRARRKKGQAMTDFEDMVRINVNRIDHLLGRGVGFATGFFCFMLTGLGLLGFYYSFETAQAIFLLVMPASVVLLMTVNKARKFQRQMPKGDDLRKQLLMLRFWIQLTGVIAILITSFWGMYYNMTHNTAWF